MMSLVLGLSTLGMGDTLAIFQSFGKYTSVIQPLMILVRGPTKWSAASFMNVVGIWSAPVERSDLKVLILLICNNWFMQLEAVLGICTLQGRYRSIHAPRSLAYETGEIVFPNMNKEIWGSLLISCAEPTTTNFVFAGLSREFFAHHLLMFLRS